MAGLFNSYNPYLQQGYAYNPLQYQAPQIPAVQNMNMSINYASEDEMRALRVPNGAQVSAFDKEKNIIYIKSADMQGKTYFEKYEYNKIDESKEQTPIVDESKFMLKSDMESILNDIKEFKSKYVTKDDFEKFRSLFAGVKNENSSGSGESIQ